MKWKIHLTSASHIMLGDIRDERVKTKIIERINGLCEAPELQGKPMVSGLKSYRSLRAVGQRFRIIYRLDHGKVIVVVVAVGLRKEGDKNDIYNLTKKLLRLGLLDE